MTASSASPIPAPMEELAAFAEELARVARSETLYRWLEGCAAENKAPSGFDPVTDADRAAELAMRRLIAERFPDHGITGEEWPDEPGAGDLTWSLDPIDGTRSFICGLPTWTTLVALLDRGAPVLGLVDAPSLDETYIGFAGHAWMRRDQDRSLVRTSSCTRLSDARLSTTDPALFDPDSGAAFDRLRSAVRTVRYGHDGYAYARLAAGSLDLVVETGLKPHDYNALIPLVSGAGGAIGDWRGRHDYDGGRIIAASTPELFEAALSYFDDLA